MTGATVPPLAPDKNIHTAKAIQMIPTMNLSFLTGHSFDDKDEDTGSNPPAVTYFLSKVIPYTSANATT